MTTKFKISGRYSLEDQAALVPALGKECNLKEMTINLFVYTLE